LKPASGIPTLNPANPVQVDDGYLLGAGDRIKLDIFNVPEYSGEYQILTDGTLNLPLVGTVPVRGMTLKQTSANLSKRFEVYLKRPIVTLSLLTQRPITIAIAGEVNRPGSYTPTTEAGPPTLTRAILMAGGMTQSANVRQIQVRRPRSLNNGADQILTLDLWQLASAGDLRQDILLRDGDSVFIPTTTDLNLAEATQLVNTSFASKENRPIRISVVGQVRRPGPYTIAGGVDAQSPGGGSAPPLPTVTRAIQIAGGITQTADIRRIQVRRPTKQGDEQIVDVNFWELLKSGDLRQDLPLQDGDTVIIPLADKISQSEASEIAIASFSPDEITVNVVGEVARPGALKVQPNSPLNLALLAAGGFSNKAEQGSVQLIRLNPNGTVEKRDIPVNLAQGVNESSNPALQNNDTIVVNRIGIIGTAEITGAILGPLLAPITGVFGLFRLLGL